MEKYSGIIAMVILLCGLVVFIRYQVNHQEEEIEETAEPVLSKEDIVQASPLDCNDEDAVVACLVASIDCHNETHKNVEIVSVRKVG